jgi:hypothetical protein
VTPQQKIKHLILLRAAQFGWGAPSEPITDENIDAIYQQADADDWLQDARNEIRETGTKTSLPSPFSRHYESEAVAAQAPDGSWVGWTYWYGGGKYGEPEAIDWIEDAYDLACVEEEKLVTVRTFTKQ